MGHFPGGFKVNNTSHDGPMMLLPNLCMQWAVASLADVTVESAIVATLIHPTPEVFILGTGPTTIPPLKDFDWYQEGDDFKNLSDFRNALNEQGTQLEILDSVCLFPFLYCTPKLTQSHYYSYHDDDYYYYYYTGQRMRHLQHFKRGEPTCCGCISTHISEQQQQLKLLCS